MGSTIIMTFDKNSSGRDNIFQNDFSQEVSVTCLPRKASIQCENIQVVTKTYFISMRWRKLYETHFPEILPSGQ